MVGRPPLLEERGDALACVLGLRDRGHASRSCTSPSSSVSSNAFSTDSRARRAEIGGLDAISRASASASSASTSTGHDAIHQAEALRFVCRKHPTRQHELHRPGLADRARQTLRAARRRA